MMENDEHSNRWLHLVAAKAHNAYQQTFDGCRAWDELATFEHCAWRDAVRAVLAEVEKRETGECSDVFCVGWKDSGTCPLGTRHWI